MPKPQDVIPKFATFGARLAYWRDKRGHKNLSKFAREIKVAQPSLWEQEHGDSSEPKAHVLLRVAHKLMLNPQYLLDGTGPIEAYSFNTLSSQEQQLVLLLRSLGDEYLGTVISEATDEYAKRNAQQANSKVKKSPSASATG